jgi:hypothetical protein
MKLELVLNLLSAQKQYWNEKNWPVNVESLEIAIKIVTKEYLKELDCQQEIKTDGEPIKIVDPGFFNSRDGC